MTYQLVRRKLADLSAPRLDRAGEALAALRDRRLTSRAALHPRDD
jgi:hypothetical protein